MTFPAVLHCLMCEDVRPELNRKATLAGFYGVAPQAAIIVRELQKPITRLVFLFLLDESKVAKEFQVTARIAGPHGEKIVNTPELEVALSKSGTPQLAIGMTGVTFRQAGRHALTLSVDGKEHYRTEFSVRQAAAEDFGGLHVIERAPIGSDEATTAADSKPAPTPVEGETALRPAGSEQKK